MKQQLVEICFRVKDREATLDFYTGLFDFEIAREKNYPDDGFDLIYLKAPGIPMELEITYNYESDGYTIGDGFSHLGVIVEDLEEMHKICKDSKYETGDIKGLSDGSTRFFFVTDPDGYRIEVKEESEGQPFVY